MCILLLAEVGVMDPENQEFSVAQLAELIVAVDLVSITCTICPAENDSCPPISCMDDVG